MKKRKTLVARTLRTMLAAMLLTVFFGGTIVAAATKSTDDLIAAGEGKTTNEWLKVLAYDEKYDVPMLIIVNEETSTRHILADGETYQLAKGDDLVVYTGKNWSFREISPFYPNDDLFDVATGTVNAWNITFDLDKFNITTKTEFYVNVVTPEKNLILTANLVPAK